MLPVGPLETWYVPTRTAPPHGLVVWLAVDVMLVVWLAVDVALGVWESVRLCDRDCEGDNDWVTLGVCEHDGNEVQQ